MGLSPPSAVEIADWTSAQAAVEAAASMDGLPTAVEAAFEPPFLLLPFREAELPHEIKSATDALIHSNMRAIYDASGWDKGSEALPESDALFLILLEQPSASGGEQQQQLVRAESEGEESRMMAALVDSMLGFASVEFSVEGGQPALYLIELQLVPRAQRKGLGSRLTAATVCHPR